MKTNINIQLGIKKDKECSTVFEAFAGSLKNIFALYVNPHRLQIEYNMVNGDNDNLLYNFNEYLKNMLNKSALSALLIVNDNRISSFTIHEGSKYVRFVPIFKDDNGFFYSMKLIKGVKFSAYQRYISLYLQNKIYAPLLNPMLSNKKLSFYEFYNDEIPDIVFKMSMILPHSEMKTLDELEKNAEYIVHRLPTEIADTYYHKHIRNNDFTFADIGFYDKSFITKFKKDINAVLNIMKQNRTSVDDTKLKSFTKDIKNPEFLILLCKKMLSGTGQDYLKYWSKASKILHSKKYHLLVYFMSIYVSIVYMDILYNKYGI